MVAQFSPAWRVNPTLWLALMNRCDEIKAATGWGLADTWGHINNGEYEAACESLGHTVARLKEMGKL